MAKAETTSTRAPRGSKIVTQAFFAALDAVPKMQQAAVAKAALMMIRDESKTRRAKASTAAAKERTKAPAKPRTAAAGSAAQRAAAQRPGARSPAARKPAASKMAPAKRKAAADTQA